jgi:hypothetical protein
MAAGRRFRSVKKRRLIGENRIRGSYIKTGSDGDTYGEAAKGIN